MRNIRVFNINLKKKYKIKRVIAGFLTGAMISATLTGCGFSIKKNSTTKDDSDVNIDYSVSSIYAEYENDSNEESIPEPSKVEVPKAESLDLDSLSNQIINSNIKLEANIVSKFLNEISSIEVNYPYSDLFDTRGILSKYNSIDKHENLGGNLFVNNYLESDYVYNIVLKNNEKEGFKSNAIMSNSDLKKVCDVITETLNYSIKNNYNIDKNLLSEKILELKIKKFEGFSNGCYDSSTGIMGFDINKLNSDSELLKNVIEHETYHLIQSNSLGEINNSNVEIRLGMSYKFKDTSVNSLYLKWFSEGCAESLMMKQSNLDKALTYSTLIRNINNIKTATILNDKNDIYDLENLSLNSDLENLFDYFECRNDIDKIEILNLMYSYELISKLTGDSSGQDFYDTYESLYGKMTFSDKSLFEKQVKGSIGQTLSKNFYRNLANKISEKNVGINEIFELISLYESVLSGQTWYSATGYASDIREFMITYTNIQNLFFEMLSAKLNLDISDIQHAYQVYNSNIEISINDISFLSNYKKEFYENIKQEAKKDKVKSIKYYFDKTINNEKSK